MPHSRTIQAPSRAAKVRFSGTRLANGKRVPLKTFLCCKFDGIWIERQSVIAIQLSNILRSQHTTPSNRFQLKKQKLFDLDRRPHEKRASHGRIGQSQARLSTIRQRCPFLPEGKHEHRLTSICGIQILPVLTQMLKVQYQIFNCQNQHTTLYNRFQQKN